MCNRWSVAVSLNFSLVEHNDTVCVGLASFLSSSSPIFFFPVVCIHRNATLFPLPTSLYLSGDNDQRFSTGICCIYGDLSCWIQLKIRVRAFFDVVISLRDKRFFFSSGQEQKWTCLFPDGRTWRDNRVLKTSRCRAPSSTTRYRCWLGLRVDEYYTVCVPWRTLRPICCEDDGNLKTTSNKMIDTAHTPALWFSIGKSDVLNFSKSLPPPPTPTYSD